MFTPYYKPPYATHLDLYRLRHGCIVRHPRQNVSLPVRPSDGPSAGKSIVLARIQHLLKKDAVLNAFFIPCLGAVKVKASKKFYYGAHSLCIHFKLIEPSRLQKLHETMANTKAATTSQPEPSGQCLFRLSALPAGLQLDIFRHAMSADATVMSLADVRPILSWPKSGKSDNYLPM